MGVDTVKLSYDLEKTVWGTQAFLHQPPDDEGWRPGKNYGSKGPLWWTERIHADGTRVVVKGVGPAGTLLWEQSVPKYLGLCGPAEPDDVRLIDRHLRKLVGYSLPAPSIRRCDVTHDCLDPDGLLRIAALGWNPHSRSRYTQARYAQDETVWQHNKTRGVRVYDKFAESGEEWARGITRVEYQVRGAWLEKMGLDRLYTDFARNCEHVIMPLVAELENRKPAPDAAEAGTA